MRTIQEILETNEEGIQTLDDLGILTGAIGSMRRSAAVAMAERIIQDCGESPEALRGALITFEALTAVLSKVIGVGEALQSKRFVHEGMIEISSATVPLTFIQLMTHPATASAASMEAQR